MKPLDNPTAVLDVKIGRAECHRERLRYYVFCQNCHAEVGGPQTTVADHQGVFLLMTLMGVLRVLRQNVDVLQHWGRHLSHRP